MDLDNVLSDIGEFGRYQKLVLWCILLPCVFPCGFHAYNQLFMAAAPDYWCKVPELQNLNREFTKNISIPTEEHNSNFIYSQCSMYDRNYTEIVQTNTTFLTNKTTSCKNGWIYDKSIYQNTVVTEWNLVCDKDFRPTLGLIIFGIGGLVGNCIFGYIQDGLGRKPAFFIYLFIQSIFGIGTAFANNFTTWIILRFGVGFTIPAILSSPCVLAIEIVGPKYRTTVSILLNIAYSISLTSLAIVVWLIREWRHMAIMTTLPFLVLFCFYRLMPESPRLLLSKGKFEQASKILNRMAKINGKRLDIVTIENLQRSIRIEKENLKKQKSHGVFDLIKTPNMRIKTIIITFIWFTNTSVYVGLSYYAPALGGNDFLNFFLAGAVELPTYLILWPAMEKWGRRWILCTSMIVGGSACVGTLLAEFDSVATLILYCMGKMGISSSFVVLPLMASELYPTVVRGLGMSISSVMGMLGPVFVPLINYLGSDMLSLPLIIMGALLVAGGACSLLLPETLNQHLPQTLEDGEKAGLHRFTCCAPLQNNTEIAPDRKTRI